MHDDITKNLMALKEMSLTLLEGLRLASHVMKNWDQIEEPRRRSLIGSVDLLIAQTESIYQSKKAQQ